MLLRKLIPGVVLALLLLSGVTPCLAAGEVVCVFDNDYPPFSFVDKGQPAGLEIELLQAVARKAGVRLFFRPLPWNQALGQMTVGHAQIITGLTPTPERRRLFLILEPPNAVATSVIMVREGSKVRSLDDLAGRRVGVQRGSNQVDQMKSRSAADLVLLDSEGACLKAVLEGKVDAAAVTDVSSRHLIASQGLTGLAALEQPLDSEPVHFALTKSQTELAKRLEEALKAVRASGEYEQIRQRWLD
jgi:ABC-type amino acid transport substrate-binding protein